MIATRTLTFSCTPWTIGISAVALVATGWFSYTAWRRSEYSRSVGCLELLRLTLVVLAAIVLNQPEWTEEFRPDEAPTVAVLVDDSGSMDTRDVVTGSASVTKPLSRREAVAPLSSDAAWEQLADRFKIVVQPFSTPQPGHGTNIHDALADAQEKFKNLVGVVLASDGDWNEGQYPALAAAQLRLKGVPVFAVPAGSAARLPDVELMSLDAPTFGVVGKAVRIPFTIDSSLPREFQTTVVLRANNGDQVEKEIRVAPMSRTNEWIVWKPKEKGDFTVTLKVPPQSSEARTDNKEASAPISIREEKLRVLIVESYPRWEYRYLRNALSRDPGVSLSCLLFHPGLNKVGGGNMGSPGTELEFAL